MNGLRRGLLRALRFVFTFLLVTLATAVLLSLLPGDAASYIAGENATPAQIHALNVQYHLQDPPLTRWADWLENAAQGDLGSSFVTKQPVAEAVQQRLPVTLELAFLATLLALLLAVPLAILAAPRAGSKVDTTLDAVSSGIVSIPGFVVALVLIYVFAFRLEWLPLFGWVPLTHDVGDNLRSALLPVVAIALGEAVVLYRVLRADLVETLDQDYIALARAKGCSERSVMWRHALRPSALPLLTLSALTLARLIGGTVLVEAIFVLPGLGSYLLESITAKDMVAVQGVVAFIAVTFLVVNFMIDVLYGRVDPRTRASA